MQRRIANVVDNIYTSADAEQRMNSANAFGADREEEGRDAPPVPGIRSASGAEQQGDKVSTVAERQALRRNVNSSCLRLQLKNKNAVQLLTERHYRSKQRFFAVFHIGHEFEFVKWGFADIGLSMAPLPAPRAGPERATQ